MSMRDWNKKSNINCNILVTLCNYIVSNVSHSHFEYVVVQDTPVKHHKSANVAKILNKERRFKMWTVLFYALVTCKIKLF